MPDSFNHVLEQFYDALRKDGLMPSYYSDLLYSLNKKHKKELEAAYRGFMEEGFGEHLDAGELARRSVEAFQLSQQRKETIERLTRCTSIMDILLAVAGPDNYTGNHDLINRLIYLLGGEQ